MPFLKLSLLAKTFLSAGVLNMDYRANKPLLLSNEFLPNCIDRRHRQSRQVSPPKHCWPERCRLLYEYFRGLLELFFSSYEKWRHIIFEFFDQDVHKTKDTAIVATDSGAITLLSKTPTPEEPGTLLLDAKVKASSSEMSNIK